MAVACGRIGRWIQLSSVGVYGPRTEGIVTEHTPEAPLGTYEQTKADWVKHVIDYGGRAGGGMQVTVANVEGHAYPEIVVGGKSGLFLFRRAK